MNKTKYIISVFFLILAITSSSQNKSQAYLNYIDNYAQLAVIQQKEFGIPASITLAQGLLESGAGQSYFARNSNNHFGIKCHDWTGDKVYHDDDAQGECFRKYNTVVESYRDHSLFLKNKPRYSFLFDYSPTNYEAWAHGLKKAGYATDPSYAYKLISIIDNYELHKFDLQREHKGWAVTEKIKEKNTNQHQLIGNITAEGNHIIYKNNRVRFVVSEAGDTYGSIADELGISEKKLREYNEVEQHSILMPGTQIYVQHKKSKSAKGYDSHVVKVGESMYSVSQNYAIRIQKLYDINQMNYTEVARVGMVLKLR